MNLIYKNLLTTVALLLLSKSFISCSNNDDEFISELIKNMTLEEKIGQMTQVDYRYLKDKSDIEKYFLGSILSGGGSTPPTNQPSSWVDLYNGFQKEALKTRLKIPLIYGIDAVHGHNNVLGATMFPHNIGLGCANDKLLVQKIAAATAKSAAGSFIFIPPAIFKYTSWLAKLSPQRDSNTARTIDNRFPSQPITFRRGCPSVECVTRA